MPCWTVQTNRVDLNLANRNLIGAAVVALGGRVTSWGAVFGFEVDGQNYTIQNGQLIGRGNVAALADRLKVEYSRQAVAMAAKRFGWQAKTNGANKLALTRRS